MFKGGNTQSPQRRRMANQRIADGSLRAERIGSQWVVDERSVMVASEFVAPGRPLSRRSAWALVALSRGDQEGLGHISGVERSRARERLSRLAALVLAVGSGGDAEEREILVLVRSWLRNRAERRSYRASPPDLSDLRGDPRLVPSGISDARSGIASGDLVEAYVAAGDLDSVGEDYPLSPADDDGANVVLHVIPGDDLEVHEHMPPLVVAADLAEHRRPREEAKSLELLRDLAAVVSDSSASQDRLRPRPRERA